MGIFKQGPSRRDRAKLAKLNAEWGDTLAEVPKERWPSEAVRLDASMGMPRVRVLRSKTFMAQVFDEGGGVFRMSVNRAEFDNVGNYKDGITWDDLQRLKKEAGYGPAWALELFPAADAVVNVANMRHLWILPEPPPFGWVIERPDAEKAEG